MRHRRLLTLFSPRVRAFLPSPSPACAEITVSGDFFDLNETASQLDEVFFSKDLEVPMDLDGAHPDLKRVLLNGGTPPGAKLMGALAKIIPSEFQAPTYRPIKLLKFTKRYSFSAGCGLTVKIFGKTPTRDRLFNLSCGKPSLSQSFSYQWEINVPIGPLNFPFTFNINLPDISGFESVLRIANGHLSGLLDLVG